MKNIKYLLLLLWLFSINAFSEQSLNLFSGPLKDNLEFFSQSCSKQKVNNNKLILIDATDPLLIEQIAFIKENFINAPKWENVGDRFSIVVMDEKPVSILKFISICAPIPKEKITDNMARLVAEKHIRIFSKTLNDSFDVLVQSKKAPESHIIEALVEIFRSKRYEFLDGKRELIIASDLYQNSNLISFYKLCSAGKCPSFNETLKDKRIANYLKNEAKLNLNKNDSVIVYQLKTQDKVSMSVKPWWEDYISSFGLPKDRIKISSQL
jgi:hypothetical protein